jgi:predicted dehydrogenase
MKRFGMAVIGLGVVGRRMLEQAARHPAIEVVSAWDVSAAARQQAATDFPGVPLSGSQAQAIERLDVDVVYVANPPLAHADSVRAALAAGKALFCEKPLGIDLVESRALVSEVERSGRPGAINFPFASSAAVQAIADAIGSSGFDLRALEIRTRFHQWPREWQASAAWLNQSDQGGFTREVLSHFVYLALRLLGPLRLLGAVALHPVPGKAEQSVTGSLLAGRTPVSILGCTGGVPPDLIEARFIGAGAEFRLIDWYRLERTHAGALQGEAVGGLPADPRQAAYQRQLDQLAAMLAGEPHTLASFADALAVQTCIEGMLASTTAPRPQPSV